jgi:hypothetical protein
MRLRSVMTMALACAASAAALAAAGPAAAAAGRPAAASSRTSGGTPGGVARPLLVRPQSGASYEWGVATPVPGLATLDDNGTGQLSAVSCAAGGTCSAGGFYTDGSTKLTLTTATVVYSREQSEKFSVTTKATGEDSQGQKIRTRHLERTGAILVPRTLRPAALIAGPGRFGPGLLAGSGYGS